MNLFSQPTTLQLGDQYTLVVKTSFTTPAHLEGTTLVPASTATFPFSVSMLPPQMLPGIGVPSAPDSNGDVTVNGTYMWPQPFTTPSTINTTGYAGIGSFSLPVSVTVTKQGALTIGGGEGCPTGQILINGQCQCPAGQTHLIADGIVTNQCVPNIGENTNPPPPHLPPPTPSTGGMSTGTMIAIGVVALGAIGGAAWWYTQKRKHVALPASERLSQFSQECSACGPSYQDYEAAPNPRRRRRAR